MSPQFGTFLGNCEKERLNLRLSERTYSLWGYMWQNVNDFANPLYNETKHRALKPRTSPQFIRFWRAMYNRHENSMHPREAVMDSITTLVDQNDSIQDHISLLTKRIDLMNNILEDAARKISKNKLVNVTNVEKELETEGSTTLNSQAYEDISKVLDKETVPTDGDNRISMIEKELRKQDITMNNLTYDNPHLSLDWQSFRGVTQCSCATPIDFLTRKYHCWNCGKVFCRRCIDYQRSLPGHYSENKVPVCKTCFKKLDKNPTKNVSST